MILTITNNTSENIVLLGLPGGGIVRAGITSNMTIGPLTREQTDAMKRLEAAGSITWSVATDAGDFPMPGKNIEYTGTDNDVPGTNVTFDGSATNYLAAKTNSQTAVVELDVHVKTNADNIGTNVTAIGVNVAALDAKDDGHLAFAEALLASVATTADTFEIGGDTYEFVTFGGTTKVGGNIAITLTGVAANNTLAAIAAVNGTAANPNPNVLDFVTGLPAPGVGSESVVSTLTATPGFTLSHADAPGGTAVKSAAAMALTMATATGTNAWRPGHTNLNVLGGRAPAPTGIFATQVPITTALIDAVGGGVLTLTFGRTITGFLVQGIVATSGAIQSLGGGSDTFVATGANLAVTLGNGGAANDLKDGDILNVVAW